MTVFAVIGLSKLEDLESSIEENYPGQSFKLNSGHWFVSDKITSKEVCDKLGISGGRVATGVVFAMSGYWGNANKQLWEWLESREAPQNG